MTSQPYKHKTLRLGLKPSRVDLTCRMFMTGRKVCAAKCTQLVGKRAYIIVQLRVFIVDVDNEKKCVRNFMVTMALVEYACASRIGRGVLIV